MGTGHTQARYSALLMVTIPFADFAMPGGIRRPFSRYIRPQASAVASASFVARQRSQPADLQISFMTNVVGGNKRPC
jgi:hypothetical protein